MSCLSGVNIAVCAISPLGKYVGFVGGALFLGRVFGRYGSQLKLRYKLEPHADLLVVNVPFLSKKQKQLLFLLCLHCSYFWGALADHKGRKPVIIISGIFMALASLSFGFSVNLAMAIISRFLTGFFNGKQGSF